MVAPSGRWLSLSARRAWIEITGRSVEFRLFASSLSARRAWIEMAKSTPEEAKRRVALRKESVDRNGMEIDGVSYDVWSLSARRAWIEI